LTPAAVAPISATIVYSLLTPRQAGVADQEQGLAAGLFNASFQIGGAIGSQLWAQ
jgi:predicted MFS family arabinose efflux permease